MKKRILWVAMTCVLALLTSCKNGNKDLLPNVSGKAGEVLVVIERADWESDLGVAIRESLAGDTPYLAQREPLFVLSNVPPGAFNSMFKVHRNLLLAGLSRRRTALKRCRVKACLDVQTFKTRPHG